MEKVVNRDPYSQQGPKWEVKDRTIEGFREIRSKRKKKKKEKKRISNLLEWDGFPGRREREKERERERFQRDTIRHDTTRQVSEKARQVCARGGLEEFN